MEDRMKAMGSQWLSTDLKADEIREVLQKLWNSLSQLSWAQARHYPQDDALQSTLSHLACGIRDCVSLGFDSGPIAMFRDADSCLREIGFSLNGDARRTQIILLLHQVGMQNDREKYLAELCQLHHNVTNSWVWIDQMDKSSYGSWGYSAYETSLHLASIDAFWRYAFAHLPEFESAFSNLQSS
jgi:hypothetical protein